MSHVLLIGINTAQIESLKACIPDSISLVLVKNSEEARQRLLSEEARPSLIITQLQFRSELEEVIQGRLSTASSSVIPVIVLIDHPDQRSFVFQSGATDYLLLPLLPSEITSRLVQYLSISNASASQEESQALAAQMAFVVLISRLVNESRDLQVILSRTLEQTVSLLTAKGGEIWLFTEEKRSANLAASLFQTPLLWERPVRQVDDQGLIAWVTKQSGAQLIAGALEHPHFSPQIDQFSQASNNYCLLSVNLTCNGERLGSLILYNNDGNSFSTRDITFLETIAPLVAAAISNAQIVGSIRNYADQQHILYEMSQQITIDLDIEGTLSRSLQWLARLVDMEIGLIWLVDEDPQNVRLASAFGYDLPPTPVITAADPNIYAEPALFVQDDYPANLQTNLGLLNIEIKSLILLPIKGYGKIEGFVTLINKIGGPFTKEDLHLLATASEMISIGVSNAQLHQSVVRLMAERERLHRQAIQNERLRTIGRLTASLAHEINNPMQSIRGALALAMEGLTKPIELKEYLRISQEEAGRVIKVIQRLRQLYRPESEQLETINLTIMFKDILETAREEMARFSVPVVLEFAPNLPNLFGFMNQFHLAFLSILLQLIDEIGSAGGGTLTITAQKKAESVRIEFISPVPIRIPTSYEAGGMSSLDEWNESNVQGLAPAADIILLNQGNMKLLKRGEQFLVQVDLPAGHEQVDPTNSRRITEEIGGRGG